MSKAKTPPVPPAGRSRKGPGAQPAGDTAPQSAGKGDARTRNLTKQGRQGNVRQNTRHQGYQQDR